ncbi:MAG: response regulator [Oscillospiraceae bacterium]|nr:response regulator [Oscillospiraceae bacterium]
MSEKIRLLLVEDTPGWIRIFEEEIVKDLRFDYLGSASSKDTAIDLAFELKPDVVVMDIFLDALSNREYGIEAAKEIRIKSKSKIVFFTADEKEHLRKEACRIGFASGYIRKDDYKQYADEIYNAVTKSTPFKESIIENVRNQLTPVENDILTKIIDGKITGTFDKTNLYSQKNISKNKTNIYNKLGLKEIPEKDKESVLIKIFKTW